MEEKIVNILMDMQKDMKNVQVNIQGLNENQKIMQENITKILEHQIKTNNNLKENIRENRIRYKEIDYRLSILDP